MQDFFLSCIIYCIFISPTFSKTDYDANLGQVTITDDGKKAIIKNDDSTISYKLDNNIGGNFHASFSKFNNTIAIYFSSRSISDVDGYITLKNKDKKLYSECIYINLRTVNLIPMQRIECSETPFEPSQYQGMLSELVKKTEENTSDYNTRLLLNNEIKTMPLLIYRDNKIIIYQVVSGNLLGNPTIETYVINSFGESKIDGDLYIYQTTIKDELFIDEVNKNSISKTYHRSDLYKMRGNNNSSLPYILEDKAFIYDDNFNLTKKYLIKGDNISLLDIEQTKNMCKIKYLTNKNQSNNYWVKCDEINHL